MVDAPGPLCKDHRIPSAFWSPVFQAPVARGLRRNEVRVVGGSVVGAPDCASHRRRKRAWSGPSNTASNPRCLTTVTDRRIQKTRTLLREALVSLIREENYDSIAVKEILGSRQRWPIDFLHAFPGQRRTAGQWHPRIFLSNT